MLPKRLSGSFSYTGASEKQVRISLLKPNTSRDSTTGEFLAPTVFADLWAKVVFIRDRDIPKNQHEVGENRYKFVVSYIPGVTNGMSVLVNGKTLPIQTVADPDMRQVELWIFVVERNG